LGFAAANNLAIRQVRGAEWIALLNPDAFPEPDWLSRLIAAAEVHPEYACFVGRVVSHEDPSLIDAAGDEYHFSGFAWRRGQDALASLYSRDEEIYMASATAVLYRQQALEEAGGFDERFFCYYEDVDLGLRFRLLGYRTRYVADAVVHHVGSGITGKRSSFVTYHTQRNRIWAFIKNVPTPWIWCFLPAHVLYQLAALTKYASQGQLLAAVRGTLHGLRVLPSVLRDRRIVQSTRRADWKTFSKGMKWGLLAPIRHR
jgi:GT2 family glycosyltransferase